jgi:deoxyinosine 3'endonuclease (endonuclease V)
MAYSGIHIYNLKEMKILNTKFSCIKPIFTEYFPSVLFLNRTNIYLDLIKDLDISLDCYIINSSGQIHPYLYGCACDFGLKIRTPVIGYTKKLLFGELKSLNQKSEIKGIYFEGSLIGYAIPKPNSKKFLYISVGNNISLQSALKLFINIDFMVFSNLNNELNNFIQYKTKSS